MCNRRGGGVVVSVFQPETSNRDQIDWVTHATLASSALSGLRLMVLAVGDKVLFCSPLLCRCEWGTVTDGSALRERGRRLAHSTQTSSAVIVQMLVIFTPCVCVSNLKVKWNSLRVMIIWYDVMIFRLTCRRATVWLVVQHCQIACGVSHSLFHFVIHFRWPLCWIHTWVVTESKTSRPEVETCWKIVFLTISFIRVWSAVNTDTTSFSEPCPH